MAYIQVFLYLQLLDFLTTMLGFRLGAVEASPFIRMLLHMGPAAGVIASKSIAVGLAAGCVWLGKRHLIQLANVWYAGLVVWNLFVLLSVRAPQLH